MAAARGGRRAHAQLRRHRRQSARQPRRDIAADAFQRCRQRIRKAHQSRRPCPGSRPRQRPGALLLLRCQAGARRAAGAAQRVSPRCCRNNWRRSPSTIIFARPRLRESRAWKRRLMCSSPRTACVTDTSSGPTPSTGLLLKARLLNEKNETIEQFAFTDIQIDAKLDRDMFKLPFPTPPADWQVRESAHGDVAPQETGWVVKDLPPGFTKVVEGYRTLRGKSGQGRAPRVLRRTRRGFGVRRADAGDAAAGRTFATGRHQRVQPAAERPSGHGSRRGARRHRAPDRVFGQPPLADRVSLSPAPNDKGIEV